MRKIHILLLFPVLLLTACEDLFEYHPNQIRLRESEKNLTKRNISRIQQQTPGDTLRLIVMGDTQRFYDDAEDFVKAASAMEGVDFVVHQGDISDFGLAKEFRWVHDILKRLPVPYLTVIGNHDMMSNGRDVYQQMYGDLNYAFVYGKVKFIFIDTNGREYRFNGKVPDVGWLQQQLTPTPEDTWEQAVIFSHMSPFGSDYDGKLRLPLQQALEQSGRVQLSLHGHEHNWEFYQPEEGNITYQITTSMNNRGFSYIKIWSDGFKIQRMHY
ncbi:MULTISPECIES: metallophosphoesterase family protein [Pontibacter]|uniref:Calcineurin-like phosphoesterase n=2 Tax=Pontibacter TaxID=323449 RepID=A0A239JD97_9BACT|nr:metallophosphoesterase [Pontibacter ummariensis]PRY08368.1 calcineurin-like phosphoesterase family protein [Pontibacter ummariensis]SNT03769.1 Calcineurin-like phosphoesterase [Pontibacter ummariensis]